MKTMRINTRPIFSRREVTIAVRPSVIASSEKRATTLSVRRVRRHLRKKEMLIGALRADARSKKPEARGRARTKAHPLRASVRVASCQRRGCKYQ